MDGMVDIIALKGVALDYINRLQNVGVIKQGSTMFRQHGQPIEGGGSLAAPENMQRAPAEHKYSIKCGHVPS